MRMAVCAIGDLMSDGPLVFRPVPAWEISIVNRDGFINNGGHVLFVEKQDAIDFGEKVAMINLPEGKFVYMEDDLVKRIPILEQYDHYFLVTLELEKITNSDLELLMEDDIPIVWFTRENIDKKCIVDIQKMTI